VKRATTTATALLAGALALTAGAGGSAAAPAVPRCAVAKLGVSAGAITGSAGHLLSEFAFVNRGRARCSLEGYPQLQMLDGAGAGLSTTDRHAPPGADGIHKRLVILAPGARAYFGAFYADRTGYDNLRCPAAARLRLTPPRAPHALTLSGPRAHIAPYGGTTSHLHCGIVELTPVTAMRFQ
jgi:Protein of unknown function (DUF4232)